jgi:hypothetical protein
VLFHFEFLSKNEEITSVIFSEQMFPSDSIVKTRLRQILARRCGFLGSIIEECQREGTIVDVDPSDLARMIIGTIRLTVLEWRLSDFSFDLMARGKRTLSTLEKIIFA